MNAHQLSNPTETPLILLLQKKVEVSLFNIDFMKAFDCIEWNFILNLLKARDFGNKWLTGSLSFFLLLNLPFLLIELNPVLSIVREA